MPSSRETTDTQKAMKSQEYVVESSSDAETDSSSSTEAKDQSKKAVRSSKPQSNGVVKSSSDNKSPDQESSGSSSEASRGKKRKAETVKVVTQSRKKKATILDALGSDSASMKELNSIPGYSAVKVDASDFVSDTNNMFSDLDGKQVWHITVPATVPIASIERLDIPAALRGEPILHHNGASYNMFASAAKDETLLLPRGPTGAYSRVKTEISRSFYLREMAPKPRIRTDADSPSSDGEKVSTNGAVDISDNVFVAREEGSKKPARQQPSGLLMRYQPFGGSRLTNRPYKLLQPDEDESDQNNGVEQNGITREPGSKKSKHGKKSKHVRSPSQETPVLSGDVMDIDDTPNGTVISTPQAKLKNSQDKSRSEKKRRHRDKS